MVMPGSGVNPDNAAAILDATDTAEIHASARSSRVFGRPETDRLVVEAIVRNINPTICLS